MIPGFTKGPEEIQVSCFKTERDVVAVDSTGKLIGTMKQFYGPICGETSTLEKVILEYKGKRVK
jgi:hypothetical protein